MRRLLERLEGDWRQDLLDRLAQDVQRNSKTLGQPGRAEALRAIIQNASDAEEAEVLYKRTKQSMLFGKWKPPAGQSRANDSGRYQHSSVRRLCTCGHPLAGHTGEGSSTDRPCINNDLDREDDRHCPCEKFTPTKRFMDQAEFQRRYA